MPLFGFMESGYRLAVVLALVFDALTTVFLGLFVLTVVSARRHHAPGGPARIGPAEVRLRHPTGSP
jgi:hypothetical protein